MPGTLCSGIAAAALRTASQESTLTAECRSCRNLISDSCTVFWTDIEILIAEYEAHIGGIFTERRNATTTAEDVQAEARSRRDAVGNDSSSAVDVYVCSGKVDCGIAERDDSSRRVRIELVQG